MTIVASSGVTDAQRVLLGLPDLAVAVDPANGRLLALSTADDVGPDGAVRARRPSFDDGRHTPFDRGARRKQA